MPRIALIGLGNIARKHAEVIRAIDGAELVAGVKRSETAGRAFCAAAGIPRYFSSVETLLGWGEFDAAIVCVSHLATIEVAKALLKAGRPCLVEKPVGFSSAETAEVARSASTARTWGMVAVNRRFYSIIRRAADLVRERGGLRAIRVEHTEWMHEAGAWGVPESVLDRYFFVNGVHLLDTMCHLAGVPTHVDALVREFPSRRNAYDAMLRFPSGAVGHYSGQWYAPGRWALDLFAEDLRVSFPRMEEAVVLRTGKTPEPLVPDRSDADFKPGFLRQMQAFLEAVSSNKPPAPPACLLDEAIEIMGLMEKIVNPRANPYV